MNGTQSVVLIGDGDPSGDGVGKADREGVYRFHLSSDDGSVLWIDGKKVVDNDGVHAPKSASGVLRLACDTLHVPDVDQVVIVYSAAADTPEAEALALLRVVGTQEVAPVR